MHFEICILHLTTEGRNMSEEKRTKTETSKEEKKEKLAAFSEIVEKIEKLSVKDLADFVKGLEDRWGVQAVATVSAGAGATAPAQPGAPADADEKAEYTIHLADSGSQKIAVIKTIREIRNDLGLKEAKDLADGAPKDIKENVPKEEAEEAKKKLEIAGAKVELK
ncbi:MAG: large subunit ribosomal protein L7/L12 [Candidatus Berkelbacteria bacterium Licking1014_7]|uniref:Large ribosomal subunit protein bL12 n=1 Tax=Candidatus Berkelbacteria bacterium Licking1014_7 TaxID=2017147 RepID=A0A554LK19_9BACT|nr:MAG: large subunit ribosomal protein L7/L12 [Candidatus Berkelbacteria bacterium Licking1014_7]